MKKTIAIASVLMAAALTGILSTSPIAFAQDSADFTVWRNMFGTKTVGSGESTNNNCAPNSSFAATVACPVTSGLPPSTLPP